MKKGNGMRIEFTRYEQIWQTRQVTWREAEWDAFKLELKTQAEEATRHKEYYTNLYNAVKDMSFDSAIQEYNKWREGDEDNCLMIADGSYGVPLGSVIHEALSDAASEAEPHEQSYCDSNEYIDIYKD